MIINYIQCAPLFQVKFGFFRHNLSGARRVLREMDYFISVMIRLNKNRLGKVYGSLSTFHYRVTGGVTLFAIKNSACTKTKGAYIYEQTKGGMMSELRHDPVQKRWVIIAKERGQRPIQFKEEKEEDIDPRQCPFCENNESKTPPEIFAIREPGSKPNGPGWKLRVIPNKFPALTIEGDLGRRGFGVFDMMNGIGAHEVIIETNDHKLSMADMPLDHLFLVASVYRERIRDLYRDQRFRYALIFKNHGSAAGASLAHSHTQLIATPITPRTIAEELESAKEHYYAKERCLFCDIITQELALGERVAYQNRHFIVICPFASRFPFECWILPKVHSHDYTETSDEILRYFVDALQATLWAIKENLSDPSYNFLLHTSPSTTPRPGRPNYWATLKYDYHWHIEVIPRLVKVAGFEWGTGFYINPVSPEIAAESLRKSLERRAKGEQGN